MTKECKKLYRQQLDKLIRTGHHDYEDTESAGDLCARQLAWARGEISGPFPER